MTRHRAVLATSYPLTKALTCTRGEATGIMHDGKCLFVSQKIKMYPAFSANLTSLFVLFQISLASRRTVSVVWTDLSSS